MAGRHVGLAGLLLSVGLGLAFAREAHAGDAGASAASAPAVSLDRRSWRVASTPLPPAPTPSAFVGTARGSWPRVGLAGSAFVPVEAPCAWAATPECAPSATTPACDPCADRFRFTVIRAWVYRSFVPDESDPDTFGLELDSEWGWGSFEVSNISYLELADYPVAVPGQPWGNPDPGVGAATGISDLLSAFLFSKKGAHRGPHHFAYGFAFQLPTASDSTLGSGKWCVGPAVEYEYERGRFYAAFVALQLWSVAGDSDRKDVTMLMIKPMITYELSRRWKAVYMPYGISVYWNKPSGNRTYVPLGGGLQYDFRIGSQEMAVSAQLFNYVARPSKGTEWDLRFMLELDF